MAPPCPVEAATSCLVSLNTLPPVTSAAVVTAGAMYPVDVVRAMRMADAGSKEGVPAMVKRFYQANGIGGFVNKGLGAELLKCTFSRVLKFWLQPTAHVWAFGKSQKDGSPLTKGIAGALTTIPEMLVISPFENAKLAQQLDRTARFASTGQTLKFLSSKGGVGGLYTGILPMQARQALWTGGYFMSLDVFKEKIEALNGGKRTATTDTMAGFGAGVFGTVLNCWPDVIRTQIQKKTIAAMLEPTYQKAQLNPRMIQTAIGNMATTGAEIYAAKGLSGLYAGLAVKSLYLGGSGALLAVLVPRFKELWGCKDL
eukprot:CAMPEP_0181289570 /NCGR_PEP_ID=MMETSP1101-20121128/950_1 /TAXON_ID=46948 /ORGANISM="Rhodomonas abbreviata, Strain Caron Lab Isolate" /LENGTH=312 /DNA_ID=CAMNT_0023393795 /DNA_START=135 /DNA_END=1073 /DNA_ORIENTATION=+